MDFQNHGRSPLSMIFAKIIRKWQKNVITLIFELKPFEITYKTCK